MGERIEKNLNLTIRIEDGEFEIDIYEPESGEVTKILHNILSFDDHREFDAAIGGEIYSWLSLWAGDEDDGE